MRWVRQGGVEILPLLRSVSALRSSFAGTSAIGTTSAYIPIPTIRTFHFSSSFLTSSILISVDGLQIIALPVQHLENRAGCHLHHVPAYFRQCRARLTYRLYLLPPLQKSLPFYISPLSFHDDPKIPFVSSAKSISWKIIPNFEENA